ncbi:MAG: glycosyltransferase family 39 protein [Planctomycetia bacterium]|nr:glycosyltransferase family 39 protein [Planctomycetia bacterium]
MIRQLDKEPRQAEIIEFSANSKSPVTAARGAHLLMGFIVSVAAALYMYAWATDFWIPHDEGLLAHTAERVLNGELPHRDFDDVYTGGLAMLHAAAFEAFGVKLTSLRWVLLGFSTLFIATVYAIAARFERPLFAAIVTLTVAAWSVPNYFAGLPSWYNLFFTTFGLAAVLRYIDTGRMRWLFLAGVFAGAGLLMKIVGVYFIAAVGLFLVYCEQCRAERDAAPRSRLMLPFTLAVACVAVALPLLLVRRQSGVVTFAMFVLSGTLLSVLLVVNEWRVGHGTLTMRLKRLSGLLLPFGLGALVPVVAFLVPYLRSGSAVALWHGVFVLPQKRLVHAALELPPSFVLLLPSAAFLLVWWLDPRRLRTWHVALFALCTAVALRFAGEGVPFQAFWSAARFGLPFVAAAACWILLRPADRGGPSVVRRQEIFLLVAVAAYFALLQYPFSAPIYFCYVAPPAILATALVAASRPGRPLPLRACWSVVFCAFAVLWLNHGRLLPKRNPMTAELEMPRGGLTVPRPEALAYNKLVEELQKHSPPGSAIYAAPDCPEFYFLSDRRNPTRTMYDFFDDPTERTARIVRSWDEARLTAAVVNERPEFSEKIDPELEAELRRRLPRTKRIGPFTLYTREPAELASQQGEL